MHEQLLRGQVPETAAWTVLVVQPPHDLCKPLEGLDVQALVAQVAIEAFDECVFHGLFRVNEVVVRRACKPNPQELAR